jgi:hypothetical protein
MYPRKQQVSCFYCEWVGRKNKSRDHWKRKHPNEKFKLKISENDLGKYRFQKETIEKTGTTTNDDDADKNKEQEQANVIILSPCAATSTASIMNTITSPSISVSGTPSVASRPSPNDEIVPQKTIPFLNLSVGALINDNGMGSFSSTQVPSFLLLRKGCKVNIPLKSILTILFHFHFFLHFS